MEGISWEEFQDNIRVIHRISNEICNGWQLVKQNEELGGTYLVKKTAISVSLEEKTEFDDEFTNEILPCEKDEAKVEDLSVDSQLLSFEYHVLYHISYGVPYLSFNACKSNGRLLSLEDAWNIFTKNEKLTPATNMDLSAVLTQMEHPALFKPFLTLHPCKTAEILSATDASKNKVLTFLSSIGPAVLLNMDLRYANYFTDKN